MAKQPADRFQSADEFAAAAVAAAGPLDWKKLTGTSLTGTSLTAPLSPAAGLTAPLSPAPLSHAPATRAVPLPRELLVPASSPQLSGVYTTSGSLRRGRPRGQTALLIGVVALFVLAGGLALAIALRNGSKPAEGSGTPAVTPTAQPGGNLPTQPSLGVVPPPETTQAHNRPNGQSQRPSHAASSRASAPSSAPASSASTTTPTTKPTTTPPTTPPATTPPTSDPPPDSGTNAN
jgi:serine/threonine-protein kinase